MMRVFHLLWAVCIYFILCRVAWTGTLLYFDAVDINADFVFLALNHYHVDMKCALKNGAKAICAAFTRFMEKNVLSFC